MPPAIRGRCETVLGNYAQAQATLEQALAQSDTFGDASLRSLVLNALGSWAAASAQWSEAERWLCDAFFLTRTLGNRRRSSEILETLAYVLAHSEREAGAAMFLGSAAVERAGSGTTIPPVFQVRYEQAVARTRDAMTTEQFDELVSLGRIRPAEELIRETFPSWQS